MGTETDVHPVRQRREPFDVAGVVRRARRLADLSQRELAGLIGVSQTTIARAEKDRATVTVPVLLDILALAGLQLAVLDASGDEIFTMTPDAVRDRAGRQHPAHLDPRASSREFGPAPACESSVEAAPPVRYRRRPGRDFDRERYGTPLYHPEPEQVEAIQQRERASGPRGRRQRTATVMP